MMPGLKLGLGIVGSVAAALLGIAMLSNFEMPGRQITVQRGFRGVAMETNYNPVQLAKYVAENKVPASLPQLPATGPKAGQVYKNVLVLGELSVGQFTRLMVSITNWVSPKQGCAYCHNTNNMAEDTYYTKIVARRMLQMTQNINANWAPHVAPAGVTCYTCHRGNNVPNYIWWTKARPRIRAARSKSPWARTVRPPRSATAACPTTHSPPCWRATTPSASRARRRCPTATGTRSRRPSGLMR